MRDPFVSIVIPSRDRAELLEACLRSIRGMDYPSSSYEILVACASSSTKDAEVAAAWGATVVENPLNNLNNGRNIGFAASRGEIVAFCDSDSVVPKEWIRNALKYFHDPSVGGVGGPEMTPNTGLVPQAIRCAFTLASFVSLHAHSEREDRIRDVPHIPTCNFITRRSALEKILPMRWNGGCGSDVELGRLIRAQGFRLLRTCDVRMWHHKRADWRSLLRQLFWYGAGRAHFVKGGESLMLKHAAIAASLPGLILLAVAGVLLPAVAVPVLVFLAAAAVAVVAFSWRLSGKPLAALSVPAVVASGAVFWSAGFFWGLAMERAEPVPSTELAPACPGPGI